MNYSLTCTPDINERTNRNVILNVQKTDETTEWNYILNMREIIRKNVILNVHQMLTKHQNEM